MTPSGVLFDSLLRRHATASAAAERAILEPTIFSKVVDYRRDVKRGKVTAEDKAITDSLLAQYKPTTSKKRTKKSDSGRG
jgi:hypothetical protein